MKLKVYMVKKGKQYLAKKSYNRRLWVTDPQRARVWTAYQGPNAAIGCHGGERITLEIDLEKAQIPKS